LAGFQVTTIGRFWVTAEDNRYPENFDARQSSRALFASVDFAGNVVAGAARLNDLTTN
jgi:hypothetical protein